VLSVPYARVRRVRAVVLAGELRLHGAWSMVGADGGIPACACTGHADALHCSVEFFSVGTRLRVEAALGQPTSAAGRRSQREDSSFGIDLARAVSVVDCGAGSGADWTSLQRCWP
jgi:hypothetical protein